jgi:ATP-dependent phosphofructokinase / diphosphate-dependent phosphofructokinase
VSKHVGILTAGGDSPGLNAAIRAISKDLRAADIKLLGFKDGYDGIAFDRKIVLNGKSCSGILTRGGTILHASRNKPDKMPFHGKETDMTEAIVKNYYKHNLLCLICIGGGGTHKSALKLKKEGLNIITLPKTIDNDLAMTDTAIGFDTAVNTATHAIDNLHSTASSHRRIMLVEIMGHRAGWLTLASGIAGGADVILIPEIPYSVEKIAEAIKERNHRGKRFSIIAIAEGSHVSELVSPPSSPEKPAKDFSFISHEYSGRTLSLAKDLAALTELDTRVTILGYLQRGGTPSSADRLLATTLGVECVKYILKKKFGIMIAVQGQKLIPVPLKKVVGKRKSVALDHIWLQTARQLGVCFGD